MPRPRKCRRVEFPPQVGFFKPQGVPMSGLKEMVLTVDGLEALRLADAEGLEQAAAAQRMGISRPTFSRLVAEARSVVARVLVNGWALRIEGGSFEMVEPWGRGRRRGRGHGLRRGKEGF